MMMREVGMGLDQSSPKSALVINNVALLVALVGGYHQLSWIISGNSIPNTAIKGNKAARLDKTDCLCQLKLLPCEIAFVDDLRGFFIIPEITVRSAEAVCSIHLLPVYVPS